MLVSFFEKMDEPIDLKLSQQLEIDPLAKTKRFEKDSTLFFDEIQMWVELCSTQIDIFVESW